jgi:hypothetical protein
MIPLSSDAELRHHLLELRYHFAEQRTLWGRLALELPRLGQDVYTGRMYWELLLPQHEHVLVGPPGFTSEYTWGWDGYFWGRKPLLGQADLETWIGVTRRSPASEGANRYLFSTSGNVGRCELYVVGRAWIVLLASGAALVVGLLLIYVPASRHPGTLFGAAVVLLCVGLLYPEPTLLLSQAAILGLGLVLLAGFLQRSVARRRRTIPFAEAGSSRAQAGSAPGQQPPPAAAKQPSTQTAPAVAPASHSDPRA